MDTQCEYDEEGAVRTSTSRALEPNRSARQSYQLSARYTTAPHGHFHRSRVDSYFAIDFTERK
jgi:hypothetical protein